MVDIARGQLGQLGAQLHRARVGHVAEGVGVGQLAGLGGNGLDHFLAAQADIGAPHAAHRVQVAVAGQVLDIGAIAAADLQGVLLAVLVEQVVAVHIVGTIQGRQAGLVANGGGHGGNDRHGLTPAGLLPAG